MKETKCKKKRFLFYTDWAENLQKYPDELRHKILDAILHYHLTGEEPTDNAVLLSMFVLIQSQMDRDNEKYSQTIEKRSQAGKKSMKNRQKDNSTDPTEEPDETTSSTESNDNKSNKCYHVLTKATDKDKVEVEDKEEVEVEDKEEVEVEDKEEVFLVEFNTNTNLSSTLQVDRAQSKKNNNNLILTGSEPKTAKQKCKIDGDSLKKFFNDTLEKNNSSMPRVQKISKARRKAVETCFREFGQDAIMKVIEKAAASQFLNGQNERNWSADFDWIFNSKRFNQILEGKYDNKINPNPSLNNYAANRYPTYSRPYGNNGYPVKGHTDFGYGLENP